MVDLATHQPLDLGRCVTTPGVLALFGGDQATARAVLVRHVLDRLARRDWGDCDPDDTDANNRDAATGDGQVVAVYRIPCTTQARREVWAVWHPHDASIGEPLTTVCLPEEY